MDHTNDPDNRSGDVVDHLHEDLRRDLAELVTSEDWREALTVAARFHDYSFSNTRLIWAQAAARGFVPSRVAGYRSWRELGRQVRRGEKGLAILAPVVRMVELDDGTEERKVVGFRPVHVFDIGATEGRPLPEVAPVLLDGDLPECWDQVADLITASGFGLEVAEDAAALGSANGVTDMVRRQVTIRGDLSGAQRFKTAVHELAHIRLHEPGSDGRPDCRGVVEVEAESVAYMVCRSVGIDSAEYSLPYVAAWSGGDLDKVTATANRVTNSARHVIGQIGHDRTLQPSQEGRDVVGVEPETPQMRRPEAAVETKGVWDVAIEPDATKSPDQHVRVVVEVATEFFAQRLHGPYGTTTRDYLTERGFEPQTVDEWRLGYAPPSWNALTQHLQQVGFHDDLLVAAGVAGRAQNGRLYDLMRGRLIFPLLDHTGSPVAFAGRLVAGDGPKYLNGPETSLYAKRTLLYGLHAARDEIAHTGAAVVVEGYTDVLAAHQAGIGNVVGTGGTALTREHIATLGEHADQIVLAFDGDLAGQLAVEHNLDTVRSVADVRVARLPAGRDPADLLLTGQGNVFQSAVAEAQPLTTHLIDRIVDRHNLDEVEGPIRVLLAAASVIDPIDEPAGRSVAVAHLAARLGRDQEFIDSAIHRYAGKPARQRQRDLSRGLS